jgi:hypothetical protein
MKKLTAKPLTLEALVKRTHEVKDVPKVYLVIGVYDGACEWPEEFDVHSVLPTEEEANELAEALNDAAKADEDAVVNVEYEVMDIPFVTFDAPKPSPKRKLAKRIALEINETGGNARFEEIEIDDEFKVTFDYDDQDMDVDDSIEKVTKFIELLGWSHMAVLEDPDREVFEKEGTDFKITLSWTYPQKGVAASCTVTVA